MNKDTARSGAGKITALFLAAFFISLSSAWYYFTAAKRRVK